MKEKNNDIFSVYVPSPTPAVILLIFWVIYYNNAPKRLLYNIGTDLLLCFAVYMLAYLLTSGKTIKARKVSQLSKMSRIKQQSQSDTASKIDEQLKIVKEYKEKIKSSLLRNELEKITKIIETMVQYIKDNPSQEADLQKLFNTYLPTFINLLAVYQKYEENPVINEEMKKTLTEIEKTSQIVREGLENKWQALYFNKAMDANANMSALETMLKQDGLIGEIEELNIKENLK